MVCRMAAPGARVLLLQPQATLGPRVTEWDDRFAEQRRRDFTSRYGFAPDMLDAAQQAYVIYDPRERLDAMHSALFERRNVSRFRTPFLGGALQSDLMTLDLLPSLLNAVAASPGVQNAASALHLSIFGMAPVIHHGSEELKRRALPPA